MAFQTSNGDLELVKLDFAGQTLWSFDQPGRFGNPALSPNGRFVAFEFIDKADETLVWLHDLDRGARTQVSLRRFHADSAAWTADGEWVYFDANPSRKWLVYRNSVHGGGEPELVGDPTGVVPGGVVETAVDDCSADGRWLLAHSHLVDGSWDIYLLPLDTDLPFAEREWVSWANSPADEREGAFSPDSEWIAYMSNASGANEIYVSPLSGGATANRWQISTNGGSQPRWSPDGTQLYYLASNDVLHAVSIAIRGKSVEAGALVPLFEIPPPPLSYIRNAYDVLPDGTGFMVTRALERVAAGVTVRVGWRGATQP